MVKGTGEAVVKALATQAKSKGVQILPGTPVVALSKEGGRINGVVVDEDGQEVRGGGQGGGHRDRRLCEQQGMGQEVHRATTSDVNLFAWGNTGKMGDGIRMAWEAGAAEEGIGPSR